MKISFFDRTHHTVVWVAVKSSLCVPCPSVLIDSASAAKAFLYAATMHRLLHPAVLFCFAGVNVSTAMRTYCLCKIQHRPQVSAKFSIDQLVRMCTQCMRASSYTPMLLALRQCAEDDRLHVLLPWLPSRATYHTLPREPRGPSEALPLATSEQFHRAS